jgi:hypothetical protein
MWLYEGQVNKVVKVVDVVVDEIVVVISWDEVCAAVVTIGVVCKVVIGGVVVGSYVVCGVEVGAVVFDSGVVCEVVETRVVVCVVVFGSVVFESGVVSEVVKT